MTTSNYDFAVHLNYPALISFFVDAAGAGDHDYCVTTAARQALEEQTSVPAESMRVVGAVEPIGESDHDGSRYSFDYLVTIEADGAMNRVCVHVDSAEAAAILTVDERFTDHAALIVAVALGCMPSDVRITETESAQHSDIAVVTDSVTFRAKNVRRDVPRVLLALLPALKPAPASTPPAVNNRL